MSSLIPLLKSNKTVFSNEDLGLYWQVQDSTYLKTKIYREIQKSDLLRLANGVYAITSDYSPLELANRLLTPSYISLRTVLAQVGALFQYDSTIYSIAQRNRTVTINDRDYRYCTVQDSLFHLQEGIIYSNGITTATPERALVDLLYLEPTASLDSVAMLDQETCLRIASLFDNKQLLKRINALFPYA
jgi:hypothetical protein